MAFGTLIAAANGVQATMYTRYIAGTLAANLQAFNTAISGQLSDAVPDQRTVGNWLVLLQSYTSLFAASTPLSNDGERLFSQLAQLVYRVCWQANDRQAGGQITAPTAAAILAAVNANLS